MSQPSQTYKRLEALFSDFPEVTPDAPPFVRVQAADSIVPQPEQTEAIHVEEPGAPDGAPVVEPSAVSPERPLKEESPVTEVWEETAGEQPAFGESRLARLARIWERLTRAHSAIVGTEKRRIAQLTAALTLGLGLLVLIGFVVDVSIRREIRIQEILLLGFLVFTWAGYAAARSRHPRIGSIALVNGLASLSYMWAGVDPAMASSSLLGILPLATLLCSLVEPTRSLLAFSGVNFLLVGFVLPAVLPGYTSGGFDSYLLASLGILFVIAVEYRNRVERQRVAQITKVNEDLRLFQRTLEDRVRERTASLVLAAEVGRMVTEKAADPERLLGDAAEAIRAQFNLYHTQIYLLDRAGRMLILKASTGEPGKQLLQRGHRLAVGPGSLNGRAASEKRPVVVGDTASSSGFFPNPLLPNTRSEMAVPLIAADRVLGVLDMQSETPNALRESDLITYQTLAGQLSVAIQNANLLAETREARAEVEAEAYRLVDGGWREFLDAIERREHIGFAYDQDALHPLGESSPPLPPGALSAPLVVAGAEIGSLQVHAGEGAWTLQDEEVVRATAEQLARHVDGLRLLVQAEQYQAQAEDAVRRLTREGWRDHASSHPAQHLGYTFDQHVVSPLNGNHGQAANEALRRSLTVRNESIGELTVDAESLTVEGFEIVEDVAERLSNHLENLRLLDQNEKRARELEIVAELSATTSTVLNPDRLLQAIVDTAKERFGVYHVHVYLADAESEQLVLAAGAGDVGREMVAAKHAIGTKVERSLVARANREGKALIVNDVRSEPDFLPNPRLPSTRSEMAVPMIVGDKILGVFDVQADRVDGFTDEDANIYTTLASQVAVALQNARLYMEQAGMVSRLRELDRLKTSFLANMSHELRTPLNSILGFADVMLEGIDGPLTENMNSDLHLIHKNGRHLLHLINDVLDMAKISAGKMNLSLERFKVHDLIEDVLRSSSSLAAEKKLALVIEADSDQTAEISADRTRLHQVLLNLVGNAVKFTEKGGIRIRTEQRDDKVLVRVSDTGVGIPKEKLDLVFQEFTQVDTSPTRKAGGTGLGLPISLSLVKMHGGRLWAESAGVPGEGTTFFVELPLETPSGEPTTVEVPEHGQA